MSDGDAPGAVALRPVEWGRATAWGALVYAIVELGWLASGDTDVSASAWWMALAAEWGFAVLLVGIATGCWWAVSRWLGGIAQARPWVAGLIVGGLMSPYFYWLALFTFSGAQVRHLSLRPALIGLVFLGLFVGALTLTWFFFFRRRRAASLLLGLGGSVGASALLWFNASFLPNEYEPLHAFLTGSTVAGLSLAAVELARLGQRPRALKGRRLLYGGLGLSVLVSQGILSQSHTTRWLVFGESAASRYVAVDLAALVNGDDERAPKSASSLAVSRKRVKREKPKIVDSAAMIEAREVRQRRPAPHLIVFSVDNLQRDRVGANGYSEHPSTPNIDRLAREGANFQRAYTHYPGTRVFLSSMLVGRRLPPFKAHRMPPKFREQALTRLLKKRDYHVLVKGVFELTFQRDFDPEDYSIDTNLRRATSKEIRASGTIPHIPLAERFQHIDRHLTEADEAGRPVFLWLHWLKPHRWRRKFVGSRKFKFGRDLDGLYDSSVAATDQLIPRLESLLQKRLHDNREVYWVVMSDHGAGLTRGSKKEVGKTLYEDQVNVPLIISGPGIRRSRPDVLVDSALDMSATILDLAGISPPEDYDGISLMPWLDGTAQDGALDDRLIALRSRNWTGAVHRQFKLIMRSGNPSLYDLPADPLERRNLVDQKKKLFKKMRKRTRAELKRSRKLYESGLKKK